MPTRRLAKAWRKSLNQGAMSDLIVQLDSRTFRAALKQAVVLVDFWEPWCGPCQIQLPVLEEVARRVAGRAIVARVNVDEVQKLAAHFDIRSLPTLVLFKNGKVVRQFLGSHSTAALTAAMEAAAKRPPTDRRPLKAYARTVQRDVKPTINASCGCHRLWRIRRTHNQTMATLDGEEDESPRENGPHS